MGKCFNGKRKYMISNIIFKQKSYQIKYQHLFKLVWKIFIQLKQNITLMFGKKILHAYTFKQSKHCIENELFLA